MTTDFPSPDAQLRAVRDGAGVLAPTRAFVSVTGPDAQSLLQNLLSQDLAGMTVGQARRALLLTPKARVIADPRVTRLGDEAFLLDLEPVGAEALATALVRYRLASKAVIEATDQWSLVSMIGPRAPVIELPGTRLDSAPPLGALPRIDVIVPTIDLMGSLATAERAGAVRIEADALEALRIEAGEVRLGSDVDERWMPAEAGLVEAAVSFDKGCFIGQEPVTRLHRRGHANRTPRRLAPAEAVPPGAVLTDGEREVGVITSVAGPPWLAAPRAIGIVRVDVADDATLVCDGVAVQLVP